MGGGHQRHQSSSTTTGTVSPSSRPLGERHPLACNCTAAVALPTSCGPTVKKHLSLLSGGCRGGDWVSQSARRFCRPFKVKLVVFDPETFFIDFFALCSLLIETVKIASQKRLYSFVTTTFGGVRIVDQYSNTSFKSPFCNGHTVANEI